MGTAYKADVVKLPSKAQIAKISQQLGYDLVNAEIQEYRDAIAQSLQATYQRLSEIPDPKLPVKYPRTPGYRPVGEDNPLNAWYWRCNITGAPNGKLLGKTIAIKDNICVAGVPMMCGSRILEGYIPDVDAIVVSRILDAGGCILGKAVCESLCSSGGSFTSATGPVLHPGDPTRMTGGSSSGCAALVAGGHVDIALGTDQGGSIRNPCGRCGIVGLKPTFGLVPYTGIIPMEFSLDHVGPMAKNVHDLSLLLEVIAGPDDGLDYRQPHSMQSPESYTSKLTSDISHLRLGLLKEGFSRPQSEPDVDELVKKGAEGLAKKTCASLQDISVPMHLDAVVIYDAISDGGVWTNRFLETTGYQVTSAQQILAQGLKNRANDLSVDLKVAAVKGKYLQDNYQDLFYTKARNLVWKLRRAFDEALTKVDVLIMPTTPMKARRIPHINVTLKEYLTSCGENIMNNCAFNMTGHPALSINAGFSQGLPVGMLMVGRKFEETTLLNVAYAFEKIRDSM